MNAEQLVDQGNEFRAHHRPDLALANYAQAFVQDPDNFSAWNNYGNVIREMGYPDRAIPFLEHALKLIPTNSTARFNLAVTLLLMGDYERGWRAYEDRWNYEHLAGTLPDFKQPRWTGQDLKGKRLLFIGEQGIGDTIQFMRFARELDALGAEITAMVPAGLVPLISGPGVLQRTLAFGSDIPDFDYWTPMMSVPQYLNITLENLPRQQFYVVPSRETIQIWRDRLGPKTRMRVGFCWSGRRDTWINQHKAMPFLVMLDLIKKNPQYEWVNLQVDATAEEEQLLNAQGIKTYPGTIMNMADTAGLIANLDVVLSVDTAVAHLAGALGANVWVMLNQYAVDWRWLLGRDDSPWYPTAKLFRQPQIDDWHSVTSKIHRWLDLNKI